MGSAQWLWPDGPRLEQREGVFPLGTDSVLLADFAGTGREKKICDIGCGTGVLSLLLSVKAPRAEIDAVDISRLAVETARRNFEINGIDGRARAVCGDIRCSDGLFKEGAYDLAICNPPYFADGAGAKAALADARGDAECGIKDVCRFAYRLGGRNARIALCWRAERLAELLDAMREYHLEPKRLRFVHHSVKHPPLTVLAEGKKEARPGLEIMPPLILYKEGGEMTEEYARIYRLGEGEAQK
ncbi:MAG: methyltransferase [Oscillospiraceae bacterium]|nr:methyltransferase [Oscillospiraceae bacterium]